MSVLTPLVVAAVLWYPHFGHYYERTPRTSPAAVEAARQTPDDGRLRELFELTPGFGVAKPIIYVREPVAVAARLLEGVVEVPGLPRRHITIPFAAADIDQGTPDWQLAVAGLSLPALLVRAYEQTGENQYLFGARDMILGWADFERRAWLPRGFLWNDHAVAARIPVLAGFWLAYRRHPSYDPALGARVLTFAARSAAFLGSPAHFTAATNHGVMQNLALWHYALAFPTLPNTVLFRQTALERMKEQLEFYVNDEGVILEHSPGYHRDGVELLGMALRYLTLMGESPSPAWVEKYRRALRFYAQLRLPNGELPSIGDTSVEPDAVGPRTTCIQSDGRAEALVDASAWPSPAPAALYPVAGYAVWWSGLAPGADPVRPSQTVVTWSYFPGHGHKHADELSVVLWAGGRSWIGNVGYWPYEAPGYRQAASWVGSNAPHLATEPATSARSTRLLSSAWSDHLAAIDLERTGPGTYVARRQIVHVGSDLWVVIDHASGRPGSVSRVQWTTTPNTEVKPTGMAGLYRLQLTTGRLSMVLGVLSSPGTTIRRLHGSLDPFAGWQVVDGRPTPVDSLLIEQPASNSWAITAWCLQDESRLVRACPSQPVAARFTTDSDWGVTVARVPGPVTLRRTGGVLEGQSITAGGSIRLALESPPDVASVRETIRAAFDQAIRHYPPFRELASYRLRATYAIAVAFVLQELAFAVGRPRGTARRVLRGLSVAAWLGVGLWLTRIYLA